MNASGRTTWWPKDAAWHRRDRVVELGTEHGAAGPNVLDVLCAWAQEQRAGGALKGGFNILAREAFVTADVARTVVEHAARIGLIDDFEPDPDGRLFTGRISGWGADAARGRAALRKADQRARDAVGHGESRSVTVLEEESRSVTLERPTREDQRRSNPPDPPQAGGTVTVERLRLMSPRRDAHGRRQGRKRDHDRYDTALLAYVRRVFPQCCGEADALTVQAIEAVEQALRHGAARDDEDVLDFVRQWFPDLRDQSGPVPAGEIAA